MKTFGRFVLGASLLSASCAGSGPPAKDPAALPVAQSETDKLLAAMKPAKLTKADGLDKLDAKIVDYFARTQTRRTYVMTDKPLYQPGETVWMRADLRITGTLKGTNVGATLSLISPRGAVVAQKRVMVNEGVAQNDFALAPDLEGGEYTIQLAGDDGVSDAKKIIVNTYEAPRLQKTVELTRKAYGAGDTVAAAIEIKRATGEPFAKQALTGVVTVDDIEVTRVAIQTDADGKAMAKFQLPGAIERGDGLLTVMASDGGVVESVQKRIPIVMKTLSMSLFPEGGDLVAGVPSRVYFMAKTPLGKPADITGRVVDDRGTEVAKLTSIHDGMGKFELTPSADRTYHVEIERPVGIAQKFDVPAAKDGGCVLRSVDGATADHLRVAATCSSPRTVLVEAVLREQHLADGAVEVQPNKPAIIELPLPADDQGAVRVTLFNAKQEPLAERLVYHGRGRDLKVSLTADQKQYSPRDPVKLHVHTADPSGKPVKANVGVAVVDDTVLSFADDKSAKILAHLYLEPELGATAQDPIEEPNFYFGDKPEAQAAMDALLATRGYRRFEWQQLLNPPPPVTTTAWAADAAMPEQAAAPPMDEERKEAEAPAGRIAKPAPPHHLARGAGGPPPPPAKPVEDKTKAPVGGGEAVAHEPVFKGEMGKAGRKMANLELAGNDKKDMDGELDNTGWSPVRVFPVPEYTRGYEGPRTDFRETIYWNPTVQTDASGDATVTFPVSDAVTSFRATAEGVSAGGVPGIGETTIQSKMPLSLDARLPVEVTSGDEIRLPITLTNETDRAIDAHFNAVFGAAFKLGTQLPTELHLEPHAKSSLFVPLEVVATDGDASVHLGIMTGGLEDNLDKKIHVVPLGFPLEASASGTAKSGTRAHHDIDLAGALPGSIKATVTMYPSPLAAMTKGMEGMIREPGGCFEQTSSTNYPNVMVLSYLASNDAADPRVVQSAMDKLDHGYKLLTGYETPEKGYEWFGHSPGHEALTAYGLMEFADMGKVYDVDHSMVERTANWLMSRRDGKGGFLRSSEAIDSFGRATETTTNAYIMWALSEAHRTAGLAPELAVQQKLAASTTDPYLLALSTNTALLSGNGADFAKRLAAMQGKDGSFAGAKESITMSGGESLAIETTSLATLALIKASPNSEYEPQIRAAVDFLNGHRSGFGEWGNTQATILGLKALTAYAEHARQMQSSGTATLIINGEPAGTISFDKGRKDALVWDDLSTKLHPGNNTVELELAGGATLPYTISIEYRSAKPASSEHAKVYVSTQLAKDHVKMGEGVKLRAHIENRTADGLPMTLARIGIPGGLVFQTWQLKELRDKKIIDFYETRPREVILYWGAMAPSSKKDIDLDLLAQSPGTYESPATSAYLYYTAEDKAWTSPTKVTVDR